MLGNINQPKWEHLKQLNELLMSMEKVLTYGDVKHTDYGHSTTVRISLSLFKIKRFGTITDSDLNICNGQQLTPTRENQVASLEMQKMVTGM